MNALTRLAELRCRGANKTRVFCRPRRFIVANIWPARSESKIRDAHRRTNASALVPFLRLACALACECLVRPAKISRIFLLGINPARNTGQRVRTENSLDKQPSRPPTWLHPLTPVTLKGAHCSRTCLQFPRVSVSWGRRLHGNIRGASRKK